MFKNKHYILKRTSLLLNNNCYMKNKLGNLEGVNITFGLTYTAKPLQFRLYTFIQSLLNRKRWSLPNLIFFFTIVNDFLKYPNNQMLLQQPMVVNFFY